MTTFQHRTLFSFLIFSLTSALPLFSDEGIDGDADKSSQTIVIDNKNPSLDNHNYKIAENHSKKIEKKVTLEEIMAVGEEKFKTLEKNFEIGEKRIAILEKKIDDLKFWHMSPECSKVVIAVIPAATLVASIAIFSRTKAAEDPKNIDSLTSLIGIFTILNFIFNR